MLMSLIMEPAYIILLWKSKLISYLFFFGDGTAVNARSAVTPAPPPPHARDGAGSIPGLPRLFFRLSVTGESSRRRFDSWPSSLVTARAGGSRGGRPLGSETPISWRSRPSRRSWCAATFSAGLSLPNPSASR